jgi:hypothetical protein
VKGDGGQEEDARPSPPDPDLLAKKLAFVESCVADLRRLAVTLPPPPGLKLPAPPARRSELGGEDWLSGASSSRRRE